MFGLGCRDTSDAINHASFPSIVQLDLAARSLLFFSKDKLNKKERKVPHRISTSVASSKTISDDGNPEYKTHFTFR